MQRTGSRALGRRLAMAGAAVALAVGTGALTAGGAAQAVAKGFPACPAPVISGGTATVTCTYTGAAQYWTAPAGVTQATFTLYGAAGGTYLVSGPGGSGAEVTGTLPVTPGTVLQVNVGEAGANSGTAFGGGRGGGGGASDIRDGTNALADRLLVAGGGGGGGYDGSSYYCGRPNCPTAGGAGGDADFPGAAGASIEGTCGEMLYGGAGGGAGTAAMGGAGGAGNASGASCGGNKAPLNGAAGSEGSGGNGGLDTDGGGGGYYGGGGGAGGAWDADENSSAGAGGGGGGSSYTGTATGASVNDDPASPQNANGEVIISYAEVLTSHSLSGHETAVSCESASLCVAVGSRHDHGVVVTLTDGAQSHALVLRGSSALETVSCRPSGCWATGLPENGHGIYLVKISSAGRPTAEQAVSLPAAVSLGPISCSSMTNCEVAGTDNKVDPAAIEIGTWTGTNLHLHQLAVTGARFVTIPGISCWHNSCVAVGYTRIQDRPKNNLILQISAGTPGHRFDADNGFYMSRVSCVSATTCYASGGARMYTIANGVPGDQQVVPGAENSLGFTGIECVGTVCEAAGEEESGYPFFGVLVTLSGGVAGPPTFPVSQSGGYTGIATRAGIGFIAIGPGQGGSGTMDTIG